MNNTTLTGGQKRPYQKPSLLVETVQMAQCIAANCEGATGANHAEPGTCEWDDGTGMVYFNSSNTTGCTDVQVDGDFDFGIACYNNPSGGNSIFGS